VFKEKKKKAVFLSYWFSHNITSSSQGASNSKSKKFKQHAIVFSSAEIKVVAKLASFVNTIWP
jgi:hypothetical protein